MPKKKSATSNEVSCHNCKHAKWDKEKIQGATKKILMGKCTYPIKVEYTKLPSAVKVTIQPLREDSVFFECQTFEKK